MCFRHFDPYADAIVKLFAAKIEYDGLKCAGIIFGRYTYACYEVLLVFCAATALCQDETEPYHSC